MFAFVWLFNSLFNGSIPTFSPSALLPFSLAYFLHKSRESEKNLIKKCSNNKVGSWWLFAVACFERQYARLCVWEKERTELESTQNDPPWRWLLFLVVVVVRSSCSLAKHTKSVPKYSLLEILSFSLLTFGILFQSFFSRFFRKEFLVCVKRHKSSPFLWFCYFKDFILLVILIFQVPRLL